MTTPGLAGFIASGEDSQTCDVVVAEVLAALGQDFEVVHDRRASRGARRRTWFDTFDWRLYKAGLTLEYAAGHRDGELRLSIDTAPAGGAVQPVTGWRASRPHQLRDLPDGSIATSVSGIVAPRALLPEVTVTVTTAAYRLLNEDGKTVARLLVEHLAVAAGDGRPLPPRLTITEVRGYLGQARRAARIVAGVPGVRPVTEPLLTGALRAVGRSPGDYSNKVAANITGQMPAAEAAATILLRLLDTVEANVPGVLSDVDTEFLHDLRVSVRRSRSALKLFGDALTALTPEELAFFAAEFKWVGDLTTPTRDLDVHLLDFEDTARGLAAAKPDDLEPFRAFLEQRRRREFRILTRGLRSPRYTELMKDWRAKLTKIQQDAVPAGGTRTRSGYRHQVANG